ncbi:MAG: preprotein translocase subunit YajC [Thermodesulfobacteriota bacterium]
MFAEIAHAMGQSGAGQQAPQGSGLMGLAPLIFIFIIFYFLLIRPQQKKTKAHQEMLNALKVGDRVITGGGIYGKVAKVEDAVVALDIADKVRIKVSRQSIAGFQPGGASAAAQEPQKPANNKKEE